ncbi:response regulator [bacterium]|nr:response regulator [bacterium]
MIIGKNIIAINLSKEMISLLFDLDYKIMEVKDCIEGIRHAIRFQPDLVIAEINSPNLNGLSMASILNKLRVRIPLILTGSDVKYKKPALSFNNVNGFLLNPGKDTGVSRDKVKSDLESIIFNFDNFELSSMEYAYSFRQHEWANLLGKSNNNRILIVEDDVSFLKLVLKRLDSQNAYDLYSAKDGLEGVFKAFLVKPHLILTDINMPNIDGLAMSQMFFILNKPYPIVFLTALEIGEIQPKMKKAHGVVGIMEKKVLGDKETFLKDFEKHLIEALIRQKEWKKQIEETSK